MKLKDMKCGIWYVAVTNGTTIKKGDHLKREYWDDAILCREAKGWLLKEDWINLKNKVELDKEYYDKNKEKHEKEIEKILQIMQ